MNANLNGVYNADAYFRLSREDGDKAESDSIVNQRALVKEFLKTYPDIQMVLVRKWGDRQLNQMSNSPLILTSRFV